MSQIYKRYVQCEERKWREIILLQNIRAQGHETNWQSVQDKGGEIVLHAENN